MQVDIVAQLPISAKIDFEPGQLHEGERLKMLKEMRLTIAAAVLVLLVLWPLDVMAQTPNSPPASSQESLKPQELEALVAPIALYPDTLLAEVLMASTYPLEVVQADRWLTANKNMKGDQFKAAVDKLSWDGSVKALVATPSVLTMMSSKLDWTQKLGDAFLAHQTEMMDAVQRLRTKAQANNQLTSTKEQKVTVRQEQIGRSLPLSRPIRIRSTCLITILLLSTASGRMRIIRLTIFRTTTRVTSVPHSSPPESHSVPDTPSVAGSRAEITGAGASIGTETRST